MAENRSWDNVLSYVKRKLGASVRQLEYTDDQIIEIIKEESLTVFSKYFPNNIYHEVIYKRDKVPDRYSEYYLKVPEELTILAACKLYETSLTQSFGIDGYIIGDPMGSQMLEDILSYHIIPTFIQFHAPNILEVTNTMNVNRNFLISLDVTHVNPITIKPALYDYFKELALADIADACLAQREVFQTIRNPIGEIAMNLDRLQKFADRRTELMELFRNNFTQTYRQKIFVF